MKQDDGVRLSEQDIERLREYRWDMTGYSLKCPLVIYEKTNGGLTRWEAEHTFQLTPEPERPENLSDLIVRFHTEKSLNYVSFFLHFYEGMLNKRIQHFLILHGSNRYDPVKFMELKLTCRETVIKKALDYQPGETSFLTYLYPFIRDAILTAAMQEEQWAFSSLTEYKRVRMMAAIYYSCGENTIETIRRFCQRTGCTPKTATEYLFMAVGIRARDVSDDEVEIQDCGEGYEEQQRQQEEYSRVRAAFSKLSPKERFLIEKRNGIGGAAWTFEQLATAYEYSSIQSAERAYKKALRKLEHEFTASEGR